MKALHSIERHSYRIAPRAIAYIHDTADGETRRVLNAIRALGGLGSMLWVDERSLWEHAYPTYRKRSHVRWRLKQFVEKGLLEHREETPPKRLLLIKLSDKGREYLLRSYQRRGSKPPPFVRPPRLDQAVHHLLVLESALRILAQSKHTFVLLLGDEELRSRSRMGRILAAGMQDEALPDGRLYYRHFATNQIDHIDIEILTSKYSDEQIRKKYAQLPHGRTLFFACGPRLCQRAKLLTGHTPILLD